MLSNLKREESEDEEEDDPEDESCPDIEDEKSQRIIKGIIPYLGSEWSFACVNLLEKKCIVAFSSELNVIIAISYEGNYYKIKFNNEDN